jgi:hypothetical protein
MPQQLASRISRYVMSQDRTVTTGSIRVHNIYVGNASADAVEVVFHDNDNIPLLNMVCPAMDSDDFGGIWLADNGLKIIGIDDADVIVTIIHSDEGA